MITHKSRYDFPTVLLNFQMLETEQLIQLLKALKITFRYPRNNALDEEAYSETVRFRLAEIFEKIGYITEISPYKSDPRFPPNIF